MSVREICRAYSVGKTAVYNLLKLQRTIGDITPRTQMRGLTNEQMQALDALLKTRKDITIPEIREEFELPLCDTAIGNIICNKLEYRYKKRQYMPASENGRT